MLYLYSDESYEYSTHEQIFLYPAVLGAWNKGVHIPYMLKKKWMIIVAVYINELQTTYTWTIFVSSYNPLSCIDWDNDVL